MFQNKILFYKKSKNGFQKLFSKIIFQTILKNISQIEPL